MIIKTKKQIPDSGITDPKIFQQRRRIVKALALAPMLPLQNTYANRDSIENKPFVKLNKVAPNLENLDLTPPYFVKNYTNYYEFSFDKEESSQLASKLKVSDWSLEIAGEVEAPTRVYIEDLLKSPLLQEYRYRLRCVEGWSMVVPWIGIPLSGMLASAKPLSSAKFVRFTSVYQPESMPKQANGAMLDWPYVEGLRIDEAMHPLTVLAVGMYGEFLPKQNGAPVRLVVPWKYGFKSIKAIVKIELLRRQPITSWNKFAAHEYGFYANVNPKVPHPRWSQHSERVLGTGFFTPRRNTELFNGYGDEVASMYSQMDLRQFF